MAHTTLGKTHHTIAEGFLKIFVFFIKTALIFFTTYGLIMIALAWSGIFFANQTRFTWINTENTFHERSHIQGWFNFFYPYHTKNFTTSSPKPKEELFISHSPWGLWLFSSWIKPLGCMLYLPGARCEITHKTTAKATAWEEKDFMWSSIIEKIYLEHLWPSRELQLSIHLKKPRFVLIHENKVFYLHRSGKLMHFSPWLAPKKPLTTVAIHDERLINKLPYVTEILHKIQNHLASSQQNSFNLNLRIESYAWKPEKGFTSIISYDTNSIHTMHSKLDKRLQSVIEYGVELEKMESVFLKFLFAWNFFSNKGKVLTFFKKNGEKHFIIKTE